MEVGIFFFGTLEKGFATFPVTDSFSKFYTNSNTPDWKIVVIKEKGSVSYTLVVYNFNSLKTGGRTGGCFGVSIRTYGFYTKEFSRVIKFLIEVYEGILREREVIDTDRKKQYFLINDFDQRKETLQVWSQSIKGEFLKRFNSLIPLDGIRSGSYAAEFNPKSDDSITHEAFLELGAIDFFDSADLVTEKNRFEKVQATLLEKLNNYDAFLNEQKKSLKHYTIQFPRDIEKKIKRIEEAGKKLTMIQGSLEGDAQVAKDSVVDFEQDLNSLRRKSDSLDFSDLEPLRQLIKESDKIEQKLTKVKAHFDKLEYRQSEWEDVLATGPLSASLGNAPNQKTQPKKLKSEVDKRDTFVQNVDKINKEMPQESQQAYSRMNIWVVVVFFCVVLIILSYTFDLFDFSTSHRKIDKPRASPKKEIQNFYEEPERNVQEKLGFDPCLKKGPQEAYWILDSQAFLDYALYKKGVKSYDEFELFLCKYLWEESPVVKLKFKNIKDLRDYFATKNSRTKNCITTFIDDSVNDERNYSKNVNFTDQKEWFNILNCKRNILIAKID